MAKPSSVLEFPVVTLDGAVSKFTRGVKAMADEEQHQIVKDLALELQKQSAENARGKIHPLIWANLAFIVGLIFLAGVNWQRVNNIEDSARKVSQVDSLVTEVSNMKTELHDLTTRLDRYLDNERPAH